MPEFVFLTDREQGYVLIFEPKRQESLEFEWSSRHFIQVKRHERGIERNRLFLVYFWCVLRKRFTIIHTSLKYPIKPLFFLFLPTAFIFTMSEYLPWIMDWTLKGSFCRSVGSIFFFKIFYPGYFDMNSTSLLSQRFANPEIHREIKCKRKGFVSSHLNPGRKYNGACAARHVSMFTFFAAASNRMKGKRVIGTIYTGCRCQ